MCEQSHCIRLAKADLERHVLKTRCQNYFPGFADRKPYADNLFSKKWRFKPNEALRLNFWHEAKEKRKLSYGVQEISNARFNLVLPYFVICDQNFIGTLLPL